MKKINEIKKKIWFFLIFLPEITNAGTGGGSSGGSIVFENPLNSPDLITLVDKVLNVIIELAVPVLTVALVYAGYLFVTAGGSEDKISTARTTFTWSVIGGAIVLGAKVVMTVVKATVDTL